MEFGFSPNQSRTNFNAMLEQSELAEELGFHTVWAHEHHSQGALYPSPILVLAAASKATRTIRLGTNMLLLPLYHPMRVAEDMAMLGLMTEGRAVLGVSVGYVEKEFRALGVSLKSRARRMEQGIPLIRELWSGQPVTAVGDNFSLEDHVLFPLPQTPPPIYVGGLVSPAVRRAARLGDGFLLSAGTTLEQTQERIKLYRENLKTEPKLPIAINRIVHVVSSQAEKERVLSLVAPAYLNLYDNWGHQDVQRLSDQERLFHETAEAHFILGEPAECIDKIREYRAHGVGHIACLMNFGNPPLEIVDRSMRLFAEKVMPHF